MAQTFVCKYCGTAQTWNGSVPPVCEKCGASQGELTVSTNSVVKPARPMSRGLRLLIVGTLYLIPILILVYKYSRKAMIPQADVHQPRVMFINHPHIFLTQADVNFTPEDVMNAVPKSPFPADQLVISSKEFVPDQNNQRIYVGELKNTSPDMSVAAPIGTMQLLRGGRVVYSGSITSEDLAPGQNSPFTIEPDKVKNTVFDEVRCVWPALEGYRTGAGGVAQLRSEITSQKVEPTTETINFTQTYRYNTMEVDGVVRNVGSGSAHYVKVYAILRDPKGGISGYQEQDVTNSLPAGSQSTFHVSVDEWGGKIVGVELVPVQISAP